MGFDIRSFILTGFILLTGIGAYAQRDSMYIKSYSKVFSAKEFVYSNQMELTIHSNQNNEHTTYSPNNTNGIGIGLIYDNYQVSLNSGSNLVNLTNSGKKSRFTDLQIHRFGKRYAIDLFMQQYQGFYFDNPTAGQPKINVPDLDVYQVGLVGQYIWNSRKFSYRAAFYQNEKQIKSAGSLLLGMGFYYFHIESDSSLVIENQKNIPSYQWGINAGYAYNLVLGHHWLLSGSLTGGLNIGNQSVNNFWNGDVYFNPTFLPRFSASYTYNDWSLGLLYVGNVVSLKYPDKARIELSAGRYELAFFHRLNFKWKNQKKK